MKRAVVVGSVGMVGAIALAGFAAMRPRAAQAELGTPRTTAGCQDVDGDGYGFGCQKGRDCNDQDASINPGQKERCNYRDDDCNGLVDEAPDCAAPAYDATPVRVAASTLLMGSPPEQGAADEHPQHRVSIAGFAIDRYEVTNERYRACVDAKVCAPPALSSSAQRSEYYGKAEFRRYPVIFVNWLQADKFCRWDGGRLPTEAEWELAARGPEPQIRVFPWGNAEPDCTKANLGGAKGCVGDTDLVGRRPSGQSHWGAMDLAGNVWEWTADWYDSKYYGKSPASDPKGPAEGRLKVMRGGCWMSGADSLRVSCRKAELPETWAPNVGFRCVRGEGK